MYCYKQISPDLYWIGGSDRRLALFENVYPLTNGVAYNSYVLLDEKIVVFDTVDKEISARYFDNLAALLKDKSPDFLVVHHMEPDHAACIAEFLLRYPDVTIVCNAKTQAMIAEFFGAKAALNVRTVTEQDTLETGRHSFRFVFAPMVHWPEVMVSFDVTDGTLFSADAFGTFGALDGNLFADEINFVSEKLPEARRYYANIVGKYGAPVQALLKKAAALPVKTVCPLHGPVWRENIAWFVDKYDKWSSYIPEENAVAIFYGSVYGHTQEAAEILASCLADLEVKNIKVYDVSAQHSSYLVAEAFRCSHLVFASSTYNAGIFENMDILIDDLIKHALQNRKVALIENGSWAATAGMYMKEKLSKCKNTEFIGDVVTIKSALKENQLADIKALAKKIASSMDG